METDYKILGGKEIGKITGETLCNRLRGINILGRSSIRHCQWKQIVSSVLKFHSVLVSLYVEITMLYQTKSS